MKKSLFFTAILITGSFAFGQTKNAEATAVSSFATALIAAQPITKDEEIIKGMITTMETNWNAKSGEGFSSVFADVHDYIVVNGMYFPGFTQKGNAAAHQALFNGPYKTYDIKLKVDRVSFLRTDLAQVIVIGAGYTKGDAVPQDPTIIMTILVEKKEDSWKVISFHNHELNTADIKQRSPMPLNVMYASWYKS